VHGQPRAGKKVLQEDLSELDSLVIARRSIGAAPSWPAPLLIEQLTKASGRRMWTEHHFGPTMVG